MFRRTLMYHTLLVATLCDCGAVDTSADTPDADAASQQGQCVTGNPPPIGWIVLDTAARDIVSNGGPCAPSLAEQFFDRPTTFDATAPGDTPIFAHATRTRNLTSVGQTVDANGNPKDGLAAVLGKCSNLDAYGAVLLDLEHWMQTPTSEQQDPSGTYATAFQDVADFNARCQRTGNPVKLVCTPGTDLVESFRCTDGVDRPTCCLRSLDERQCFVKLDLAQKIAPSCDVYEIQSQSAEMTPEFVTYIDQAAAQATAAHPGVTLYAGIALSDQRLTDCSPDTLHGDIHQTFGTVTGYWMNEFPSQPCVHTITTVEPPAVVSVPEPTIATTLLQEIDTSGPSSGP